MLNKELLQQVLAALTKCANYLDELPTWSACGHEANTAHAAITALREALAAPQPVPDMRHPKIQSLIGQNARLSICLRLVEQLLDDPHFETTASDMEYWDTLHDKLYEKLSAAPPAAPAPVVRDAEIAALQKRVAELELELDNTQEQLHHTIQSQKFWFKAACDAGWVSDQA